MPLLGTDYYVKTAGSDSNTGLSDAQAWKTITKVNTVWAAGTFAPGDCIYFNRGDTFYGTLTITESGSSSADITVGAYGLERVFTTPIPTSSGVRFIMHDGVFVIHNGKFIKSE